MGFFDSMFGDGGMGTTAGKMGALADTGIDQGHTLFGQSQNNLGMLTPFLQREMTSPTGLGATTMAQMGTQAGQATAGGTGAGMRTAMDMGARTGNTAAVPGLIANMSKAGAKTQADNVLDLNVKNAMQKLTQQQEGASGIQNLFGTEMKGANDSQTLANDALKNQLEAQQAAQKASQAGFGKLMGGISSGLDMLSPMMPSSGASNAMGGLGSFASMFA